MLGIGGLFTEKESGAWGIIVSIAYIIFYASIIFAHVQKEAWAYLPFIWYQVRALK